LDCWILPCYDPFLLGVRFEMYEAFISVIFKFLFSAHSKPQMTETTDTELADMGT
jgi:hypothetical protein